MCRCAVIGRNFNCSVVNISKESNLCTLAVLYSRGDWFDVGNIFSYFAWPLKLRYKKSQRVLRSLSVLSVVGL